MHRGSYAAMKILHQTGHNYKWNVDSFVKDGAGDGLIFSPRHIEKDKLDAMDRQVLSRSLFDPQFFVPAVAKGKLSSYDFFPNVVANGFETDNFDAVAEKCAAGCIDFQRSLGLDALVVPTRIFPGQGKSHIKSQHDLFVDPTLRRIGAKETALLQLIITASQAKDSQFTKDLLNWVTGIQKVSGVYLIVEPEVRAKQTKDIDLLTAILSLVDVLRQNDMEVVLGYLNTEALLMSIADPTAVTMGAYENTRIFNRRNFEESKAGKQQGPSPRLYMSKLYHWIDRRYLGAIEESVGSTFYDNTKYQAEMFVPSFKWHFTKPELYKHHFAVMYGQLNTLSTLHPKDRYKSLVATLEQAMKRFNGLADDGVILDSDNDGAHVAAWLTAAHRFAKTKGWK